MKRSLTMQLAVEILSAASFQLFAAAHQSDQAQRQLVAIRVYDLAGVSARIYTRPRKRLDAFWRQREWRRSGNSGRLKR